MELQIDDIAFEEANCSELYNDAVALCHSLPFISCSILQRTFQLPFGSALRILEKLKSEGYSVLDEKDIVENPKIKIVFINNTGTESIQDIITKAHPDIEVIQFFA